MSQPDARPLKGILLSLAAFSLWACGDALVKYLGHRESIYALAFWTEIVVIAILLIVGVSGKMGTLRHAVLNPHLKWSVLRGALVFVQFMSGMYCFIHMELAKAYTLIFTAPLLTALLAFLLMKESVGMVKSLAIALGFAGVLVVLRPGLIPLEVPVIGHGAGLRAHLRVVEPDRAARGTQRRRLGARPHAGDGIGRAGGDDPALLTPTSRCPRSSICCGSP